MNPQIIIKKVCDNFHVSEEDIRGNNIKSKITPIRHFTWYLVYHNCNMSYTEVSRVFKKHVTTVREGILKAEYNLSTGHIKNIIL